MYYKADFRFAPSQLETALLCNDASHRLGASLESALYYPPHENDFMSSGALAIYDIVKI